MAKSRIEGLSLEIREMIFNLMHPKDLVALMYAYPCIHTFLSSPKQSRTDFWRVVLAKHVGTQYPYCPRALTAGQFAEFVFGDRCMTCREPHDTLRTHFKLLTRLCIDCYPDQFVSADWIMNNLVKKGERFPLAVFLKSDHVPHSPRQPQRGSCYSLFLAKKATHKYRGDIQIEPAINKTGELRERYIIESRSNTNESEVIGEQVQLFTRATRRHAILARLKQEAEGWTEADFPINHTAWNAWISKEGNLTEADWKYLYSCLKPVLEHERGKKFHLNTQRKCLLDLYEKLKEARTDLFFPMPQYVFSIEPLKSICDMDAGEDLAIVTQWQSKLHDLENTLQTITNNLINEVQQWYRGWYVERRINDAESESNLRMATFRCDKCRATLWLETFYRHSHFVEDYSEALSHPAVSIVQDEEPLGFNLPKAPSGLYFDKRMIPMARALIRTSVPTWKSKPLPEIFAMGDLFVCNRCDELEQNPVGFIQIARHMLTEEQSHWYYSSDHNQPHFRLLTESEATEMKAKRSKYMAKLSQENHNEEEFLSNQHWGNGLTCRRCSFQGQEIGQIIQHIEESHSIVVKTGELGAVGELMSDFRKQLTLH